MATMRLISRLDIKGPNLIKSIQLEGVRVVGDPNEYACRYYEQGIDEILYMDAVASLYDRDTLGQIVENTAENVFVPITVGGGLRSVQEVREMLERGADKIALNTAATKDPTLITAIAEKFGSQCMVLQIDAKRQPGGGWEAYCDGGREHTGLDAIEWARRGQALGAGEILLTSVDQEGTQRGFDRELVIAVNEAVTIPVIASGGMGNISHLTKLLKDVTPSAVAMAHVLHYGKLDIASVRRACVASGAPVRNYDSNTAPSVHL